MDFYYSFFPLLCIYSNIETTCASQTANFFRLWAYWYSIEYALLNIDAMARIIPIGSIHCGIKDIPNGRLLSTVPNRAHDGYDLVFRPVFQRMALTQSEFEVQRPHLN